MVKGTWILILWIRRMNDAFCSSLCGGKRSVNYGRSSSLKNNVCHLVWTANVHNVFMLDHTLSHFKMERNVHTDGELVQTLLLAAVWK